MAKSFALDISKWCEQAGDKADLVVQKVAMDLFRRVILRTPVDTGRARANWQASIGSQASTSLLATDKTGGATVASITGIVAGARFGDVVYLVNNVVYIIPLENGHSRQAPAGMVGITLAEFNAVVDRASAEAKQSTS